MKKLKFLILLLANFILLVSCQNNSSQTDELEGVWFRSYKNKVWDRATNTSFERGETHVTLSFMEDGSFTKNRTVFGLYDGTSIQDTTAIVIENGTYSLDNENIDITLTQRLWWDSFYGDMEGLEESGFNAHRYQYMTYNIIESELFIQYFIETDIFTPMQEIPGLDKFGERFMRQ